MKQSMAAITFGIQITLLTYDEDYWFYWLWLVVIPFTTFWRASRVGIAGIRNRKLDFWYAILWMLHVAGVAGVYYGYYDDYSVGHYYYLPDALVITNLVFSSVLFLSFCILSCKK